MVSLYAIPDRGSSVRNRKAYNKDITPLFGEPYITLDQKQMCGHTPEYVIEATLRFTRARDIIFGFWQSPYTSKEDSDKLYKKLKRCPVKARFVKGHLKLDLSD